MVAAIVGIAVGTGLFAPSEILGDAPIEAPEGSVAYVESSARFQHFTGQPWTVSVSASVGEIELYEPHTVGSPTVERSGDENVGTWRIDGQITISDWNGNHVDGWDLEPMDFATGEGQAIYRIQFEAAPLFLPEAGSYTVVAAAFISFTDPSGNRVGSLVQVSDAKVIEFV